MVRHDDKNAHKESQRLAQSAQAKRQNTIKFVKKAALWLVIIAVLVFGFQYILSLTKVQTDGLPKLSVAQVGTTDHVFGDGKILLVEYSDFQCPACKAYEPLVDQVVEKYGENITLVYRHFPLRSIHRHAQMMAQASEAAALQGKFWEYKTALFESQDEWKDLGSVKEYAIQKAVAMGMDAAKFEADMTAQSTKAKVENDYQSGIANRLQGTPSFFVNGQKVQFKNYEELESIIKRLQ
ncbi:MAG TPA: thioredoxin domain-containing protein [Acidobacteriota bacterium]|nr:thioredoxin domain-containing protein [Acidobacteriota bacterium]